MNVRNQAVLATDLDGTWIPLPDNPQNQRDLQELTTLLTQNSVPLIYVTGRHLESVEGAVLKYQLPHPDWIICDVGATICRKDATGKLQPVSEYHHYLQQIVQDYPLERLAEDFSPFSELRLQEAEKQGRFKLSYYASPAQFEPLIAQITAELNRTAAPWDLIASIDPFNGEGLIDLLPRGTSKAHALQWWCQSTQVEETAIVYAGDSGNDYAAFVSGYRTIVVGNADRRLAEQIQQEHHHRGYVNRLHLAETHATSGVLEGCRFFGIIE